jgi:hypothetical protein
MLKKKAIKEVKVEEVKKPLGTSDLLPIVDVLELIKKEVNALKERIDNIPSPPAPIITTSEPQRFPEEFRNINDKLFDINQILNSFTLPSPIVQPIKEVDNSLLTTIAKTTEETKTIIQQKKERPVYVFDVFKDNNGIYKVIATPKN